MLCRPSAGARRQVKAGAAAGLGALVMALGLFGSLEALAKQEMIHHFQTHHMTVELHDRCAVRTARAKRALR